MWAALPAMESLVRRELRRRRLWQHGPGLLGYGNESAWHAAALGDLAHDAYDFAVLKKLKNLVDQLAAGNDPSGYVALNTRNFVTDRQRTYDPVGYAVFRNVEAAATLAVREQRLHATRLTPTRARLRNETVLALVRPDAPAVGGRTLPTMARAGTLIERLREDDRWPALAIELTRTRGAAQRELCERIVALGAHGVVAFRFRELVDGIKDDVRARLATDVPPVEADRASTAAPQSDLSKVAQAVYAAIDASEHPPRVKPKLRALFDHYYARSQCDDDAPQPLSDVARALGESRSTVEGWRLMLRHILHELDFFP